METITLQKGNPWFPFPQRHAVAVGNAMATDEELLLLRACYQAFLQRRIDRGGLSVRTRQGYDRLRQKYQPRVRFLQSEAPRKDAAAAKTLKGSEALASTTTAPKEIRVQEGGTGDEETRVASHEPYSDEEDDAEVPQRLVEERTITVAVSTGAAAKENHPLKVDSNESESEEKALRHFVEVFFDARVKRQLLETVWPLAHHGRRADDSKSVLLPVPEWQELEQHKYYALMLKTVMWLFPGVPAYEAQEQAERDWRKDCEFDAYGSYGLSFEGFMVSMLDLAVACTDGSVEKCIEFFTHMAKQLEISLPIFRVPTGTALPTMNGEYESDLDAATERRESIAWRSIQLEQLFPCAIRVRPQYFELITSLSNAPVILMILAGTERPIELQLSTSAKLLVRERDHRSSVRRNTIQANGMSHFIEIEKQYLWTYRSFPGRPTLLVVPSAVVSRRTLALYACCRLLEAHEHTLEDHNTAGDQGDPLMTFFTSVNEPFPLLHGRDKSLCGRIDRQTGRLFVLDHRERNSHRFSITFKTSLIHNACSAGGAGAAAVLASVQYLDTTGAAYCKGELIGSGISSNTTPHSFIFVVEVDPASAGSKSHPRSRENCDAHVPPQWFTTLCGSNENKTIFIDASTRSSEDSSDSPTTMSGLYYVYVFTIHGFYFEAIYEDCDPIFVPTNGPTDEGGNIMDMVADTKLASNRRTSHSLTKREDESIVFSTNDQDEVSISRPTLDHPGSVSSAALLRQLLLLRKQRRANVDTPPECLGGSKITSMRILTTAVGLRAKFLRARAAERRARSQERDEAFRAKVRARLMKAEEKKRAQRRGQIVSAIEHTPDVETRSEPQTSASSELDAKATVLVNFFKEMAIYHPTQEEIEESLIGNPNQINKEDELLEHFADLFNDDHALHNILDAEKWLTSEEKSQRRQSILNEHMQHRRRTVVDMKLEQVPDLSGHQNTAPDDSDDGRKLWKTTHQPKQASEDYLSTATFIQRLMREVEEEHERERCEKEFKLDQPEVLRDDLDQVAASWTYASSTHSPRRASASERAHFQRLEALRRDAWIKSKYIHDEGLQERLVQRRGHLRPTLVPSVQPMENQTSRLSWQPVWNVSPELDFKQPEYQECDEGKDAETKIPHTRQRPKTAGVDSYTPRPPSSTASRINTVAAINAAAVARLRTRRIRSATAGTSSTSRTRMTPTNCTSERAHLQEVNQPEKVMNLIPQAFLAEPYSAVMKRLGGGSADDVPNEESQGADMSGNCEACEEHFVAPQIPVIKVNGEAPSLLGLDACSRDGRDTTAAQSVVVATKKVPKKKKKRMTPTEKRFARRVQELLEISPVIQQCMSCEQR